jgi:hypothetical protein
VIANAISVARRRDSRRSASSPAALALSGDHQDTQPGVRQRVEAREPVGKDP